MARAGTAFTGPAFVSADESVHRVADGCELAQELHRYLAEGYDIERAADGWVVLRRDFRRIAVVRAG